MTMDIEIFLRLGGAMAIGTIIGLNRDLHGKATGVRTLGVVALAAALVVLAAMDFDTTRSFDWNPVSRAIQGILTGIGFLGAGVIVRDSEGKNVQGFTTAALIWLTACLGIVCGLGAWAVVIQASLLVFVLLTWGGAVERWLHQRWPKGSSSNVEGRSTLG